MLPKGLPKGTRVRCLGKPNYEDYFIIGCVYTFTKYQGVTMIDTYENKDHYGLLENFEIAGFKEYSKLL